MFLILLCDNHAAEKCTDTFDPYIATIIGNPNYINFDLHSLFKSDHFQDWELRKRIKLEPSTMYHPQTEGQSEIANKRILQSAQACKVEGNE